MSPRLQRNLTFFVKVLVATGFILWLVRSGALRFGALAIFVERPWLIALNVLVTAIATVIRVWSWRLLLELAGVRLRFGRLVQLHFVGVFFHAVIPGVGGELVKAIYVARDAPLATRPAIILVLLLENAIYLTSLFFVAAAAAFLFGPAMHDPTLRRLAFIAILFGLGSIGTTLAFVLVERHTRGKLELWIARLEGDLLTGPRSRLAHALNRWVAINRLLADLITRAPGKVFGVFLLCVSYSALTMVFFAILTGAVLGHAVSYGSVATVYSLGLAVSSLPITPAGVGVGHAAFERLFGLIGLPGGANAFNVYLVTGLFPALAGVIPYLTVRREGLPTREEAASLNL